MTMWLILVSIFTVQSRIIALKYKIPKEIQEKGNDYWYELGRAEIDVARGRENINKLAKNIIIFVGDGMGITVTTAGRIYKGQKKGVSGEEGSLIWERFPNIALMKTYNVDKQVPDSAGTATAYFGGVKGNYETLGVNGGVAYQDCRASLTETNKVHSILRWCQDAGKETGFVTTTRLGHATPAALFAHTPDRDWECDTKMKSTKGSEECKDIARQLLEDLPGKNIQVVFAGGRRQMGISSPAENDTSCLRSDSRNLVEEWLDQKKKMGSTAEYVTTTQMLRNVNVQSTDFIMGLFGAGHTPYEHKRDKSPQGTPSLSELTETAIKRLSRSSNGYFLMVEGGRIDHSLHETKPFGALEDLLAFEEAVQTAAKVTSIEDTLIIVTADHSHVMTMTGYPERGNDILGTSYYEFVTDGMPYTTLMFTVGSAANYTWDGQKVKRANLTGINTRDPDFMSQAAVPVQFGYEPHGGEDIATYAVGPYAHLFHRVHEQSYVAHVMGYAACVGPYQDNCGQPTTNRNPKKTDAYNKESDTPKSVQAGGAAKLNRNMATSRNPPLLFVAIFAILVFTISK